MIDFPENVSKFEGIKEYEVTNTTYLISNLDATIINKKRFNREDFNSNFSIVEEMDIPIKGNLTDLEALIMNTRSYRLI